MEPLDRRDLLKRALGAGAAALAVSTIARAEDLEAAAAGKAPDALASDESFWGKVRAEFVLDARIVNLNHAGVGASPRVVHESVKRRLDEANLVPAHYLWRIQEPAIETVRARLAAAFGCDKEELAITRNASESLEICQLGIELAKGDEVLSFDHDYFRMLEAWRARERRDGIVLRTIPFPMPATHDEIVARFEKALTAKTRVVLVTHMTNRTGYILPVKRICDIARQRGVHSVVDGAQSFAQFPFKLAELGCDYFGTSLHKWLMAPHGTGFLYVRKERLEKLWPLFTATAKQTADIRKLEEIGTHSAAAHNAIADALDWNERLGLERKAARLRYLRERWSKRLARVKGAKVLTDPVHSCGIGLIAFDGVDHAKLAEKLFEKHGFLVIAWGDELTKGLRVSPNVGTSVAEVDAFCEAVEQELAG